MWGEAFKFKRFTPGVGKAAADQPGGTIPIFKNKVVFERGRVW